LKSKTEIVSWLVNNQATTLEIIEKVNTRLISDADKLYSNEVKSQWYDEVTKEIQDEMAKTIGINPENLFEKLDKGDLEQYIDYVKDTNE
jgi:hypothetical protein